MIGERIAIDVRRSGAVQMHQCADTDHLIRPRVGDRRGILRGDGDESRRAVVHAVIHDQPDLIRARLIHGKTGRNCVGDCQRRQAAGRQADEAPLVGQRISVNIRRVTTVKKHLRSKANGLIRTGICHGWRIKRADRDAGGAACNSIADGQRDDEIARHVDHKRRHDRGRTA